MYSETNVWSRESFRDVLAGASRCGFAQQKDDGLDHRFLFCASLQLVPFMAKRQICIQH
jgi:hypothetical protein